MCSWDGHTRFHPPSGPFDQFAGRLIDELLVRRRWVLKVWSYVVDDRRGHRPLEPDVVLRPRRERDFMPDSLGKLTHPVDIASWEGQVRARFAFLDDLDDDERRWATCDERQRREVDLVNGRLSVNRTLVSVGYELHETKGKTRTVRRCIDLGARTVDVLDDWKIRRVAEDPTFDSADDAERVFARPDGAPTHPQLLSDGFKRLVQRSGLPRIRFHDLRHTHATLLLKAGVPIKVVSERLGHSTPGFTMATYQHILPGMQAEAAQTFAELLEDPALLPASSR